MFKQDISTIAIIIPYFGKFPNYFSFWLESCRHNPTVDWYIFTDDTAEHDFPDNVYVIYKSFNEVVALVQENFDFKVSIPSPYKLCDFKPTYGTVFSEYIKGYDFWGFGDLDLIYGDIRRFLTENILKNHDKILVHGPFCLIKNEKKFNEIFKNKINSKFKYREVYSNPKHIGFDEYGDEAYNSICENEKLRIYKNNLIFADINSWKKHFVLTYVKRVCSENEIKILEDEVDEVNKSSVFVFTKGKLIRKYIRERKLIEYEYMYVHFQKRKMEVELDLFSAHFLMIPNKFMKYKNGINIEYLEKHGGKKFFSNRRLKRQLYVYVRTFIKNKLGI